MKHWIILLFGLLVLSTSAMGEAYGEIRGKVLYKGKPKKNAELEILGLPGGMPKITRTDKSGAYVFSFIEPGNYVVTAMIEHGKGIPKCASLMVEQIAVKIEDGKSTQLDLEMVLVTANDCWEDRYFSIIDGMTYRFSETYIQETAIGAH